MNWSPLPPAVAAVAAAAISVARRVAPLVLESPVDIPGPGALGLYALGAPGSAVAVGAELAVVAFAGLALSRSLIND